MKAKAVVFTGPTLARSDLQPRDGMVFLPPAAQGDVYRAARERPLAIGIVDGYFEGQASVWHKEILWAMDQGIHVFGSASMGALRAAELHVFGMRGVGRIFEAYRDGRYEDDDEVAVLHAPADAGFLTLSEPMANIRATLELATDQGIIERDEAGLMASLSKKKFYQERRWPDLLNLAERDGFGGVRLQAFKTWLAENRVDRKALDALEMLDVIAGCLAENQTAPAAGYHFEWTEMWDEVVRNHGSASARHGDEDVSIDEAILDEVRLELTADDPLYRLALLRHLLASDGDRESASTAGVKRNLRERLGLFRRADLDAWLRQHHLDDAAFEQMMRNEALLDRFSKDEARQIGAHILDQLRLDGRYAELAAKAEDKRRVLEGSGGQEPGAKNIPLALTALRAWYFESRCRRPMPDDIDDYARRIGFANLDAFDRALRREYLYVMGKRR